MLVKTICIIGVLCWCILTTFSQAKELVDISVNLELEYPLYYDIGPGDDLKYDGRSKIIFDRLDHSRLFAKSYWAIGFFVENLDTITNSTTFSKENYYSDSQESIEQFEKHIRLLDSLGGFRMYRRSNNPEDPVFYLHLDKIYNLEAFSRLFSRDDIYLSPRYMNVPLFTASINHNDRSLSPGLDYSWNIREDNIFIEILNEKLKEPEIYVRDIRGGVIDKISSSVSDTRIIRKDISNYTNGVYIVTIETEIGLTDTFIFFRND